MRGKILRGVGGFYYVKAEDGNVWECRARGIFRRQGIKPLPGDFVEISITSVSDMEGNIDEIVDRKNFLIRPPLANVDLLVIVASAAPPVSDTLTIDKLTVLAADKGIEPLIVLNKLDLKSAARLHDIYTKAGFTVIGTSVPENIGIKELKAHMKGKECAFAGNSGVGKSSLLNTLHPAFDMLTGGLSEKTDRGKHTTRHVELFELEGGGYIADTPGFSILEFDKDEFLIPKENLQFGFREFEPYLTLCKFTGCSHTKEKGCAVLEALHKGDIQPTRHESYLYLYDRVKDRKDWERR